MTITDAELVRALAACCLILLGGCGTVAWWAVRVVVRRIGSLEERFSAEMRGFDRRITRVEAVLRLPTPMLGDAAAYVGPDRRAGD